MTKKEYDKLQQKVMNKLTDINKTIDFNFYGLQGLAQELGLPVYCSAKENYKQLMGTEHETRAEYLYENYLIESGKRQFITFEYGSALADLDFWK